MSPSQRKPAGVGTLQVVVGAMTAGATVLLVVAIAVRSSFVASFGEQSAVPLLSYVALGYAVLALLARAIVPNLVVGGAVRRIATGQVDTEAEITRLKNVFATKTIVAAAMIEGAALLAVIAYLIEGTPLSLVIAPILIVILGAHFPRRANVDEWLRRQSERVVRHRQFGG